MKKTWTAICLAALLALPLAGCESRTSDHQATPAPSLSPYRTRTVDPIGRDMDEMLDNMGRGARDLMTDLDNAARNAGQEVKQALR